MAFGECTSKACFLHHIDFFGHVVQGIDMVADLFGGFRIGFRDEENGLLGGYVEVGTGINLVVVFYIMGRQIACGTCVGIPAIQEMNAA